MSTQFFLDETDIETLINLLLRSQQLRTRAALCLSIGIDPKRLAFIREPSDSDFFLLLIRYLDGIREKEALCKLCCKELLPVFHQGKYATILREIAVKLNCNQNPSIVEQPTSPTPSPVPVVKINPPLQPDGSKSQSKRFNWLTGGAILLVAALVVGPLVLYQYYQSSPKDRLVSTPISSPTTASVLPGNYPERIRDIQPSPPNGSWRYGGSKSLVPLEDKLKDPIRQAFSDNFHLNKYLAIGTVAGRTSLLQGQLDFILASEKDNTPGLDYKFIARDAIAIAVNPQLQISRGLTLEELKNIYTGKITNWKNVGGPNLPITAFYRSLNKSGTSEYFRQTVLENGSFAPTVQSHDNDPTIIARVVFNTAGAIYFGSASEVLGQCDVKPIAIGKTANNFILPYQGAAVVNPKCPNQQTKYINLDAINQKQYPLVRDVFVAVQKNPNSQKVGEAYANMLLTNEGQGLIKDAGFAPLYSPK